MITIKISNIILVTTIGLWLLSLILFLVNKNNKVVRSVSILALLCGFGGVSEYISVNEYSWSQNHNISLELLCFIQHFTCRLPLFIGPYFVLMVGLTSYDIYKNDIRKKHILYSLLLIPVILSYIVFFYGYPDFPYPEKTIYPIPQTDKININYLILSIWAVPYILIGNFFTVMRFKKEIHNIKQKRWLLNATIVVPFTTYAVFSNYIFLIFNIENAWYLYAILIPIQSILFIYFAKKYGVLGVRIKVEKHNLALTKVFNHIHDSVIILDENLEIVEVNEIFIKNFGKCNESDNIKKLFEISIFKSFKKIILKSIENKSDTNFEFTIDDKFYNFEINMIIDKNIFQGVFIIGKDITEYKKNIQLLKENQIQMVQKEKLSAFSHLISGLAHNMKTPLMSSLGGIAILKKQTKKLDDNKYKDDETIQKIIKMQTKHENMIQHNISNVSKSIKFIQNQSEADDESKFSIEKIIKEVEFFLSFELPKNNCVLKTNINNIDESKLSIDNAVVQVLNNLIINSMQSYNDIENENIKNIIELNIYYENNNIIFTVRDYGCGIPEDIQTRIFNKMTTTKGNEGSGLGLYITNIIVKAKLKGSISFESSPKGTTFSIMIPIS